MPKKTSGPSKNGQKKAPKPPPKAAAVAAHKEMKVSKPAAEPTKKAKMPVAPPAEVKKAPVLNGKEGKVIALAEKAKQVKKPKGLGEGVVKPTLMTSAVSQPAAAQVSQEEPKQKKSRRAEKAALEIADKLA